MLKARGARAAQGQSASPTTPTFQTRAADARPGSVGGNSDAPNMARVMQAMAALKKRTSELETLLRSDCSGILSAVERKQKGCNMRLVGLESQDLFRDRTGPLWAQVLELRTRLETTERTVDQLLAQAGLAQATGSGVRLGRKAATTTAEAKDDADSLCITLDTADAKLLLGSPCMQNTAPPPPAEAAAAVGDDYELEEEDIHQAEVDAARSTLERIQDDIRAKEERLLQLDSRLLAKTLGATPGTAGSTLSSTKLPPPSPPSLEKKKQRSATFSENSAPSRFKTPLLPLMSATDSELSTIARLFQCDDTPTDTAALRDRVLKLEKENTALCKQIDNVAELRRTLRQQQQDAEAEKGRAVEDAVRQSHAEIARLGRLLEDEIRNAQESQRKLEAELRDARRLNAAAKEAELSAPVLQKVKDVEGSSGSVPRARRGSLRDSNANNNRELEGSSGSVPRARGSSLNSNGNSSNREPAVLCGKYVIGLTGNKCSGRSTVAAMLSELGATVVDVDQLAQDLQVPGTAAYGQIVEICGVGVLEGQRLGAPIKRDELARVVYADAGKMQALERLMGPAVNEQSCRIIQEAKSDVVVYSTSKPELFNAKLFNALWVVASDRDSMVQRLVDRDGVALAEARRRVDAQPLQSTRVSKAAVVLTNSSTVDALKAQVVRAWSVVPTLCDARDAQQWEGPLLGRLVALDGNLPHVELREGARVTLGRDAQCNVVVADVTVSHLQCRIKCKGGQFSIQDFSTNGTYVNMKKIGKDKRAPLQHGDTVWLSKAVLKTLPKTTRLAYLFQRYDCVASQTLYFPAVAKHATSSRLDQWVKQEARRVDGNGIGEFWFNTVTGQVSSVDPRM